LKPSPSGDAFRVVASTVVRALAAATQERLRLAPCARLDAEGAAGPPEMTLPDADAFMVLL
jgi:hypothetical protein